MTERAVVILGFAVVLVATAAAVLVSHLRRDRVATLAETLGELTGTRTARILAVLVWAWLGWHFLAR